MPRNEKPIRLVRPRLWTALGTLAAAGLASGLSLPANASGEHAQREVADISVAAADMSKTTRTKGEGEGDGESKVIVKEAGGEGGEGEGGSAAGTTEADFLASLGFMEGHLRAGMKLYEEGDLAAAKTHMGHPIKEKYGAVAEVLEERGFGDMKAMIVTLSDAAEAEEPYGKLEPLFDHISARIDAVGDASPGGAAAELRSLALLTRIAADEYAAGTEGGKISNLHEYQDAWGFLRAVEVRASAFAESSDPEVAEAGKTILEQVRSLDKAFGDIQGEGDMEMDPALLYGAAAHMEIAALGAS